MQLSLIWAMTPERVIGRANALPWHLPEDLKHFKRVTMGKPVVMGRRTFESIGRPLPGRPNIVMSRSAAKRAELETRGVIAVADVEDALAEAHELCEKLGVDECMVIGGAEAYARCLDRADRLYCTVVHATIEGDTFFPAIDISLWRELECRRFEPDTKHAFGFTVCTYARN